MEGTQKLMNLTVSMKMPIFQAVGFDIFAMTYAGRLTYIVEHFEELPENVLSLIQQKNDEGKTALDKVYPVEVDNLARLNLLELAAALIVALVGDDRAFAQLYFAKTMHHLKHDDRAMVVLRELEAERKGERYGAAALHSIRHLQFGHKDGKGH